MKINELMLNNTSQNTTKAQSNEDFSRWLERPTRQSNGDEYYWQHQHHLQHSALQFTARLMHAKSQPPLLANNRNFNVEPDIAETHSPIESTTILINTATNINHKASTKEWPELIRQIQHTLEYTLAMELSKPISDINNNRPKCKIIPTSFYKKIEYKNHHLHIKNQEIELSVHLPEMNKQEKKELQQVIHHYLKKKGFNLTRLIINGIHFQ